MRGPWAEVAPSPSGAGGDPAPGWLAGPHGACTALCLWLLLEQRMVPPPLSCLRAMGACPWLRPKPGAGGGRAAEEHGAVGTTLPPRWGCPDTAAALTAEGGQRREGTSVSWLLGRQLLPGLQDSLEIQACPSSPNERRRLATQRDFLLFGCCCVGRDGELGSTELRIQADSVFRITPGDQLHPGASRGDSRAGSAPGAASDAGRAAQAPAGGLGLGTAAPTVHSSSF